MMACSLRLYCDKFGTFTEVLLHLVKSNPIAMKNKNIVLPAILLILSIGNYSRLEGNESVRTIQFLSIFAIGMLSGILIRELIARFRS